MKAENERSVRPSLLDRLIDDNPGFGDAQPSFGESVRAYKAGLLRDVEWLLNTRRIPEPVPEAFTELAHSVYLYGLPDTTSLSADDPAVRRTLQLEIEECVRRFEPRLTDIEVTLLPPPDDNKWAVRFAVEATLLMDPDPERIVFNTTLDPSRGVIRIAGATDA